MSAELIIILTIFYILISFATIIYTAAFNMPKWLVIVATIFSPIVLLITAAIIIFFTIKEAFFDDSFYSWYNEENKHASC